MKTPLKKLIKQILCSHMWDRMQGYYEPAPGANCLKCGKVNRAHWK